MLEAWEIILLGLLGILVGWINVIAGGGSMFSLPVMVFMGIPAPVANGTNRPGILLQSMIATYAFFRRGYKDLKLSLTLSLMACIGASGGAMVGVHLEGVWFNRTLAFIMVGMILVMMSEKPCNRSGVSKPKNLVAGHLLMIVAGFWGGFIQLGVGFILIPVLHRVMGLDMVMTNMHKIFIVMMFTIVALFVFAHQVEIYWVAAISMAMGNALGGWLGAHTTMRKSEAWVKRFVYIMAGVFIIKLLLFEAS